MPNKLGPITTPKHVVILNPDNSEQGWKSTGAGSPNWVTLSNLDYADFRILVTTQLGATGLFYGDFPIGVADNRIYPLLVYSTAATSFSSETPELGRYQPSNEISVIADAISDELDGRHGAGDWTKNVIAYENSAPDALPIGDLPEL